MTNISFHLLHDFSFISNMLLTEEKSILKAILSYPFQLSLNQEFAFQFWTSFSVPCVFFLTALQLQVQQFRRSWPRVWIWRDNVRQRKSLAFKSVKYFFLLAVVCVYLGLKEVSLCTRKSDFLMWMVNSIYVCLYEHMFIYIYVYLYLFVFVFVYVFVFIDSKEKS